MLESTRSALQEDLPSLPESLWQRVASAPCRLLMLDYDGTLAPFVRERMSARMLPEAAASLGMLLRDRRNRVAIVSGRPIDQLVELTEALPVHLVGEHGWEERMSNGLAIAHDPDRWTAWRLGLGHRFARSADLEHRLEVKRTALVLHLRGVDDPDERRRAGRVAAGWRALAIAGGLVSDRIDGGWELRARGRGKGTAVRELRRGAPPDSLAVYVGDDVTDEDAFRALRPDGITIRVGSTERPTAAEYQVESPAEVARFLARWAALAEEVA